MTINQPESNTTIIWVHSDCLTRKGPALSTYPDAPALWVWDEALLREWQVPVRQALTIYELLIQLPVVIRRGDVITELLRFAQAHNATRIATTSTDHPGFLRICRELEANGLSMEIFEDLLMLTPDRNQSLDLPTFAGLWQAARQPTLKKQLA
jgi:hypothetical protein